MARDLINLSSHPSYLEWKGFAENHATDENLLYQQANLYEQKDEGAAAIFIRQTLVHEEAMARHKANIEADPNSLFREYLVEVYLEK